MNRRRFGWPIVALAASAVACLAATAEFGQRLEYEFSDTGAELLRKEVDSDVVIVGIDAKSVAALHEWPWPRARHAALIDRIAPAVPARLFIDIDFSSSSNRVDDGRLEEALASWPGSPVVLPAFSQYASAAGDDLVLTRPLPQLLPHVALASVVLQPGADGLVRRVPMDLAGRVEAVPSLAALLTPTDEAREDVPLDFTIDPASFRFVSYIDVLENRIPAEVFADKTVFVGATAIELGDMIPVPIYRSLPGVVVQALALETARRGGHHALSPLVYWSLVIAWTLLLSFFLCRQSWRRNLVFLVASLLFAATASLVMYSALKTLFPVVPLAVAAITAYLLATLRSLESQTLKALVYAVVLRKRDALLKSIVLSSTDSIICIDDSGTIKTANPAAELLFRSGTEKLPGKSIFELVPSLLETSAGDDATQFSELVDSIRECAARSRDGEEFPVELSFSRVRLKDERLYTAIIRDISERKAQQRQLQFQATHDPLTTLPNRPALAAHLDSLLASFDGTGRVALMMIDLDRFKEVNDTLGHNVGDYVLYEVARRLERVVVDRGFIARIGGDEFALVVNNCGERQRLSLLSAQLVDCLRKPIETCGVAIDVGLSIGIATYPDDANDAESLFKNSDVAMYVAKRSATGFEYYDSANDRHSIRKLTIATRLRQAIADCQLELHYQPKVDLASGRVDSAEALLRWNDEMLGVVAPDEFIALAESTDLIQPLSNWTLTEAFRRSAEWRDGGVDVRVAVNVSARLLQDASFPRRLGVMMKEAKVAPDRVELEITESAMMVDPNRAMRVIDGLHELGVLISIDDYGTGYSSLAYLRDLPVHALKLDKSFVSNMRERDGDRVIVESTVQMAHAMNLKIVAEGVETADDAEMLREMGYDYAQGYWYSKALAADAFAAWVRKFNSASLHDLRREGVRAG